MSKQKPVYVWVARDKSDWDGEYLFVLKPKRYTRKISNKIKYSGYKSDWGIIQLKFPTGLKKGECRKFKLVEVKD